MPGLLVAPGGTLIERTLAYLQGGPADSLTITRDVLGLTSATRTIADRVAGALLGSHPRIHRLVDGRWSLAVRDGAPQPLSAVSFAIVDIETTGNRARVDDRITEIAVVTLIDGQPTVLLDQLVNPDRPIPRYVAA